MSVRNGFSTLNRLLGKKNKDKSISKSSTNLSLSSNHIDTTLSSHLQTQNRITPLPVATSNAPFEQTFRITVLLPRDQLYVARLGAKIKLEKLLELVCENKQLDPELYEFRHSTDSSQVFSLELTIGSVGLTEIRLCHKSETYDNFNADEIIKLRHQTVGRDSLSSSEFSSRNSKHTKTASPYSSTNSLNSIDSTGMNTNYRAPLSLPSPTSIQPTNTTTTQSITSKLPPVAPVRKKRMAPRPPNHQNSIVGKTNGVQVNQEEDHVFQAPLPRKEFHESTPNLSTFKGLTILENSEFHQSNQSIDLNGNINKSQINNGHLTNGKLNGKENLPDENHIKSFAKLSAKKRPMSMHIINQENINIATTPEENEKRLNGNFNSTFGSVQSLNTEHLNGSIEGSRLRLPEPRPRNKIVVVKKKTVAPAPPPRNLTMPPVATPRITTTTTSIINESNQAESEEAIDLSATSQQNEQLTTNNISKVMLNQSEIDGGISELSVPFSPKSPPSDFKNLPTTPTTNDEEFCTPTISENHDIDFTNVEDRQTDSGIGEPIPTTDSLPPSEASHCDESLKSNFETSSDDDEHVKVYNLKLGRTIIQPVLLEEHKTIENLTELSAGDNTTNISVVTNNNTDTNSIRSNSPNWTYTIPAPPNFADMDEPTSSVKSESSSTESACCDDDIMKTDDKKFIKERSPVNFQVCKADVHYSETEIQENDDPMIIKECEIFKKCKPVRKDEEICKNDQLNIDSTPTSDISIINSDIEDGYHGNKNNCNNASSVEEYLNKENLRKDNLLEDIKDEDVNRCSTDINITKSDVLNELNNVISENCIDKIIKKSDENENIESVGPCNLSNFKITTYNPSNCPVKIFHEQNNTQDEIFKELDDIRLQEDNEKLYRKRTSLTTIPNIPVQFLKTRRSITRSDSFHSTALQQNNDKSTESFSNLQNSRSSSFLSLLATQKQENSMSQQATTTTTNLTSKFLDTNRGKSSSELSIGESPSLQSLIIMKSILNGRKNSLNNDTETDKVISIYGGNQNKSESSTITTSNGKILEDCCNGIEPKNNSKVLSQDIFQVEQHITSNGNININNDNDDGSEKSDDQPEKKWKYQGPPSINLSTWNERPKIQSVTIKNEGDYIFGGNNNNKVTTSISPLPRNYRCSLPSPITATFTSNQQYPNTNNQSPPITPINSSSQTIIFKQQQQPKIPFVRSVEYKKMNSPTTININNNDKSNSDEIIPNPKSLSAGTTMTLGRIPKINNNNRQLNTQQIPIVKGFQSLENCGDTKVTIEQFKLQPSTTLNNDISTNTLEKTNLKPNLINNNNNNYRYSYAGGNIDDQIILNRKIDKDINPIIPAFAQIQLRKTGLKEKICPNNNDINNLRKPLPAKRLEQLELENENCTKLEIKLTEQKINSSIPIVSINNNGITSVSTLPSTVPSPPPPPIIRSVVTKQNSNGLSSASATIDSRDQLLSAIRDFNKNELKQS